jgi:predicted component of type VI protein secretion system
MTTTFKLVVKSGDDINKIYLLDKEKNMIGRDPKSDFVIDDIEISRNHLEVIKKENTVFLEDLNSTNGTFLNGKRLEKTTEVADGDLISLGKNIVLEFIREKTNEEPQLQQIDEFDPSLIPVDGKEQAAYQEPIEQKPIDEELLNREPLENDILEQKDEFNEGNPREKVPSKLRSKFHKMPTWVLIIFTALGFLVIFCLIPLLVVEVTDQWCNLFAGFFNSMSPGVCP